MEKERDSIKSKLQDLRNNQTCEKDLAHLESQKTREKELESELAMAETRCESLREQLNYIRTLYQQTSPQKKTEQSQRHKGLTVKFPESYGKQNIQQSPDSTYPPIEPLRSENASDVITVSSEMKTDTPSLSSAVFDCLSPLIDEKPSTLSDFDDRMKAAEILNTQLNDALLSPSASITRLTSQSDEMKLRDCESHCQLVKKSAKTIIKSTGDNKITKSDDRKHKSKEIVTKASTPAHAVSTQEIFQNDNFSRRIISKPTVNVQDLQKKTVRVKQRSAVDTAVIKQDCKEKRHSRPMRSRNRSPAVDKGNTMFMSQPNLHRKVYDSVPDHHGSENRSHKPVANIQLESGETSMISTAVQESMNETVPVSVLGSLLQADGITCNKNISNVARKNSRTETQLRSENVTSNPLKHKESFHKPSTACSGHSSPNTRTLTTRPLDQIDSKGFAHPTVASKLKNSQASAKLTKNTTMGRTEILRNKHYRFHFNDIPFILGQSTGPSRNMGAKIQTVLAMLKSHHPSICKTVSSAITDTRDQHFSKLYLKAQKRPSTKACSSVPEFSAKNSVPTTSTTKVNVKVLENGHELIEKEKEMIALKEHTTYEYVRRRRKELRNLLHTLDKEYSQLHVQYELLKTQCEKRNVSGKTDEKLLDIGATLAVKEGQMATARKLYNDMRRMYHRLKVKLLPKMSFDSYDAKMHLPKNQSEGDTA